MFTLRSVLLMSVFTVVGVLSAAVSAKTNVASSATTSATITPAMYGNTLRWLTVGTYDRSATRLEKIPGKRKVRTWEKGIPELKASYVQVYFDTDQHNQTWRLKLTSAVPIQHMFEAITFKGTYGSTKNPVKLYLITKGALQGSILTVQQQNLNIYSQSYALRFEPEVYQYASQK